MIFKLRIFMLFLLILCLKSLAIVGNDYPTVGIVSMEWDSFGVLNYTQYTSYIAASYVKHLQAGGFRPVVIRYNAGYAEIDDFLTKVNGNCYTAVMLLGGRANILRKRKEQRFYSEITEKSIYIIKRVIEMNDNGIYLPIFGTCLGFEVMLIAVADEYILEKFDSEMYRNTMIFTDTSPQSRLLRSSNPQFLRQLTEETILFENHQYGVSLSTYMSKSN